MGRDKRKAKLPRGMGARLQKVVIKKGKPRIFFVVSSVKQFGTNYLIMLIIDKQVHVPLLDVGGELYAQIKADLTISNPAYVNMIELNKVPWKISKYLEYYEEDITQKVLKIPIGYMPTLLSYKPGLIYIDRRSSGKSIVDFEFKAILRDYQQAAVDSMLERTVGTVRASTGSGKTVIGIRYLCERNTSTLILVDTIELANQWIQRLKDFTNLTEDQIGMIGNKRKEIRPVTVALLQSLHRMSPAYFELLNEVFGCVICDECHMIPANTYYQVMNNLNAKYKFGLSVSGNSKVWVKSENSLEYLEIEKAYIKYNNKKAETRVLTGAGFKWLPIRYFIKHRLGSKKLYEVSTNFGRNIKITEDHSVLVYKDGKIIEKRGKDLSTSDNLILENFIDFDSSNLLVDTLDHISLENKYFNGGFTEWINENIKDPKEKYRKKHGKYGSYISYSNLIKNPELKDKIEKVYIEGFRDNWVSSKINPSHISYLLGFYIGGGCSNNRLHFYPAEHALKSLKKSLKMLSNFSSYNEERLDIKKSSGASYEVKIDNKLLANIFSNLAENKKVSNKRIPHLVWDFSKENKILFLKGLLDSDRHLQEKSRDRKRYVYTTISKNLAEEILQLLKSLNIVGNMYYKDPSTPTLKSGRVTKGKNTVYYVRFSYYDLWEIEKNPKYCGQKSYSYKDTNLVIGKIKHIKENTKKEEYVYDLSIDSKEYQNFIANDIVVHNSATPKREDGLTKAIFWAAGPICYSISEKDLSDFLSFPEYKVVDTNYYYPLMAVDEYVMMVNDLATDDERNDLVAEYRRKYSGKQTIILCSRVTQVLELQKRLPNSLILISSLVKKQKATLKQYHGYTEEEIKTISKQTTKKYREHVMEELSSGACNTIISTYGLFNKGIDINSLELLLLAGPVSSEVLLRQSRGRIMRKNDTKKPLIIDFNDHRVGLLKSQAKKRKKILLSKW